MTAAAHRSNPPTDPKGITAAIGTNLMWGTFPIYFSLLLPATAGEIVAARIVLSFAMLLLIVTAARRWRSTMRVMQRPRLLLLLVGAGILLAANWVLYVTAIEVGKVLEASLAYFITPILSALLGALVLRERASRTFWASVAIAAVAVVVLVTGYGEVPWLGLTLAMTFALYGLLKRLVGPHVDAVDGLTIETGAVVPLGIAYALHLAATGQLVTGSVSTVHLMLVLGLSVVSLLPFITFGIAAKRLQLMHLGFIGYITPVLIFTSGVLYFGEEMPLFRWLGFAMIWVALLVFAVDAWRSSRQR